MLFRACNLKMDLFEQNYNVQYNQSPFDHGSFLHPSALFVLVMILVCLAYSSIVIYYCGLFIYSKLYDDLIVFMFRIVHYIQSSQRYFPPLGNFLLLQINFMIGFN